MISKYKNILFFFIINFSIFLFVEIIFTIFFIFHASNFYGPLAKLVLKSGINEEKSNIYNIKWDNLNQKLYPGTYKYNDIEYKVNSRGFLGEEFSYKNKNGCRIIALGGSTTAGLETNKPYPKILKEKFLKKKINCEVLNFGFSGKGLNFLENLLVNEAIDYSPNMITIMSNRNAIMYDSYGNSSISPDVIEDNLDLFIYKTESFLYSKVMVYRFFQLSYKRIISKLSSSENRIVDPYDTNNFRLKKYFETKYQNQMKNIYNFCKKRNIKVIFIKQGYYLDVPYQKSLKELPGKEILKKLMNYHTEPTTNKTRLFWIYTNIILNKSLDKIKEENPEVIIVDPIERLYNSPKEENFFKDGLHLKSNGNEIIADELIKSIMKNLDLSSFSS